MLVETGGVWSYTPGRGNFEAAQPGEQAKHRSSQRGKTLDQAKRALSAVSQDLLAGDEKDEYVNLPGAEMVPKP